MGAFRLGLTHPALFLCGKCSTKVQPCLTGDVVADLMIAYVLLCTFSKSNKTNTIIYSYIAA